MKYILRHGFGPGTIPKGIEVISVVDHPTNCYKQIIEFDRDLSDEELKEFDIIPYKE